LDDFPHGTGFNAGDTLFADKVGKYKLRVTDVYGCIHFSNEIFVGVTAVDAEKQNAFLLFPNPAKSFLNIHLAAPKTGNLIVKDILGREVIREQISGKEIKLNIAFRNILFCKSAMRKSRTL
jgi:hypothetical protein